MPLSTVATVSTGPPEAEIDRENLKTFVGVTARLSGRDLGSAVAEIRAKLSTRACACPRGMSIQFGGLYEQQQSSFKGLLVVLFARARCSSPSSLLFEFGDWRAPLLTSVMALAVLAGVFGALLLTGMTLNISSFVGAIMMVGIVGENAVFVIHEARAVPARGRRVREEAWADGGRPQAAAGRDDGAGDGVRARARWRSRSAKERSCSSRSRSPSSADSSSPARSSSSCLPALYATLDPAGRLAGGVGREGRAANEFRFGPPGNSPGVTLIESMRSAVPARP